LPLGGFVSSASSRKAGARFSASVADCLGTIRLARKRARAAQCDGAGRAGVAAAKWFCRSTCPGDWPPTVPPGPPGKIADSGITGGSRAPNEFSAAFGTNNFNRTETAKALGISRRTLVYKIQRAARTRADGGRGVEEIPKYPRTQIPKPVVRRGGVLFWVLGYLGIWDVLGCSSPLSTTPAVCSNFLPGMKTTTAQTQPLLPQSRPPTTGEGRLHLRVRRRL